MYVIIAALLSVSLVYGQPIDHNKSDSNGKSVENEASSNIWKGTPMDAVVGEFRSECTQQSDSAACFKVKVLNLLEEVLEKDNTKESSVSLVVNENSEKREGRSSSSGSFMEQVEDYIQKHDVVVKSPADSFLSGTTLTISPRKLDDDELTMSVKLPKDNTDNTFTERGKKHKLKRILVPILVFVLLKAMTLIPLAIGILSLKAWNALQLSFISFLVSVSLAIFQLFKKVAVDSAASTHIPWESYPSHYSAAARNFLVDPQQDISVNEKDISPSENAHKMAYSNYAPSEAY